MQVTNGQCEFGLRTNCNAGNWCCIDDLVFYLGTGTTAGCISTVLSSRFQLDESPKWALYPNPISESLTITLPVGSRPAEARVYNAIG